MKTVTAINAVLLLVASSVLAQSPDKSNSKFQVNCMSTSDRFCLAAEIKDSTYAFGIGILKTDKNGKEVNNIVMSEILGAELHASPHESPNRVGKLYLFENDGNGNFTGLLIGEAPRHSFERFAIGKLQVSGNQDIVVIDNCPGSVLLFKNPGQAKWRSGRPWHRTVLLANDSPNQECDPGPVHRPYDAAIVADQRGLTLGIAVNYFAGVSQLTFLRKDPTGETTPFLVEPLDYGFAGSLRTVRTGNFGRDGKSGIVVSAPNDWLVWYEAKDQFSGANCEAVINGNWCRHTISRKLLGPAHGNAVNMLRRKNNESKRDIEDVVIAAGFQCRPHNHYSEDICTQFSDQVVWFENPGSQKAEWKMHTIGKLKCAFEAIAVDLVKNKHRPNRGLDVVATSHGCTDGVKGSLVWFENSCDVIADKNGNPQLVDASGSPSDSCWQPHEITPLEGANQIAVADLDGDGFPDIIVAAATNARKVGLQVWRNLHGR